MLHPRRSTSVIYSNRTQNVLTQSFTVNNFNQLTGGSRAGRLTVGGTTTRAATNVTVNTTNAIRYADHTFASTNHALADGTNTFTAIGKDNLGRIDTHSINAYLPASPGFGYDSNGNMVFDGLNGFEYDDENQLTRITHTNAWKSEFTYDGKLRRRVRKEYTWRNSLWVLTNEVRYVYDGNLVLQERDANTVSQVTYTRGKDLSGSIEGAGGIGGLLARTDHSTLNTQPSSSHAYYSFDGNGNVTALINTQQVVVARYLYDPFGNTLSASGPLADANLYRFSSKECEDAVCLSYFLYRYYSPRHQLWINRDLIGEFGGLNLYAFVGNNPISHYDSEGAFWGWIPGAVMAGGSWAADQKMKGCGKGCPSPSQSECENCCHGAYAAASAANLGALLGSAATCGLLGSAFPGVGHVLCFGASGTIAALVQHALGQSYKDCLSSCKGL